MIDPELLSILCCPETHADLLPATAEQTEVINSAIAAGRIKNRAGEAVTTPIQMALMRADNKFAYVVREDIPVMLVEEAIPLEGLF
jgi:uncharacterized protein YbaR (Trm112 family)